MDMDDFTPALGGSLRIPVTAHRGQVVAQFTVPATPHPDELWNAHTRMTDATRDGSQGDPLGDYRPGHGLEHEPLDDAEKASQHTAQNAWSLTETARGIRAALRGGIAY
ncbi:hypothetical protein [Trebonia sp.]|uniref:hypothetical protein n=1 Tax=Trebonia sp. TaxID=2767075 RepID=UPI0026282121|nr:hypothetical protein [Trebonia sp.]